MTSHARDERHLLADLFDEVGPDAPTLCEGWTTADLAAHLIVRERRPDAAAGFVIRPLSGYSDRVLQKVKEGSAWPKLVDQVRHGPPWPLRMIDEAVNTCEYFVHNEDVRRAQAAHRHTTRDLDPGLTRALWNRIKPPFGRLLARHSPVGLTLLAPGFGMVTAKKGADSVTVTGGPGELTLFLFGRSVADVRIDGDEVSMARLRRTHLGF